MAENPRTVSDHREEGVPSELGVLAQSTAGVSRKMRVLRTSLLASASLFVAALGIYWYFDFDFASETEVAIRDYASQHRRTDLRFPGARYTPVKTIQLMADQFDMTASALSIVETDLKDRLTDDPGNFDSLFAEAQIHLLHLRANKALDVLERLHPFHRDDLRVLGALAYGYYLRGRAENRTRDLLRSIDLLEEALEISPRNEVLLFNAGTAYERARLRRQARARYEQYLKLDNTSSWAGEIKVRLMHLEANREEFRK